MMKYKGYAGQVEYDDKARLFHGEVINVRNIVAFQGRSMEGVCSG